MLPPTDEKQKPEFRRRPVYFVGEQAFTSTLLALISQQPPKAYFLLGQGEIPLTDTSDRGFQKFADVVRQNYIDIVNLNAIPNTGVPADCNLLIIAAPTGRFDPSDLELISKYLQEGGRLMVCSGIIRGRRRAVSRKSCSLGACKWRMMWCKTLTMPPPRGGRISKCISSENTPW